MPRVFEPFAASAFQFRPSVLAPLYAIPSPLGNLRVPLEYNAPQGDDVEKDYQIGRITGLRLSVEPLFLVGTMVLWIALSGMGILLLDLPFAQAVVGGLIAALLYWVSEIIHQLGHAYAARRTGYPMVGIHLGKYLFFGASLYPENEEPLPAKIHIRRALGGPVSGFVFTIVTGAVAWILYPRNDMLSWLALFLCIINLLVFTVGPFLPLGFTDGSTLLKWWGRR